ncbi:MAG: hypothetical protein D6790_09560, partial [Caldilineae bacterium]
RQHFTPRGRRRERISTRVVEPLVETLPLPETERKLGVAWDEIVIIEPVGEEHVYDLTVEGLHSFVADNVIVHNCVYQEQIIQILSQLAGYSPGEADLVRRAVGKKKAAEIERHKSIFIEGCAQNGIPKETAAAIYGDIEFFARYGFNKAHAADYAVITVQTAYLKALYPVEYMAALLLVERDKTEKVVNFINECRRMGIQVLPPDVNYSGLDFEIQEVPEDSAHEALTKDPSLHYDFPVPPGSAIRFGMAAVKNVGEGPVQVILKAREEGGPFESLEDFCDRVDLRQVNKRALECLIKVGALDRWGRRSQLLEVLDQMVARSAATHSAKESGQLSMFDLLGGAGEPDVSPIRLPDIEETKSRERLQWEKELLGVYASSHPVQQVGVDLSRFVTCSCAELGEQHHDKNVTLAGMIAGLRTTITKKGDKMAFLQLEDLQGQCEVVVFPRTYETYKDLLELERVVLVKGKAQTRNNRTSVLADSIQTAVEFGVELPGEDEHRYQDRLLDAPTVNGYAFEEDEDEGFEEIDPLAGAPRVLGGALVREPQNGYAGPAVPVKPAPPPKPILPDVNDALMDEDDVAPLLEESPFANEMPDWMLAEYGGEDEGRGTEDGGRTTDEASRATKDERPMTEDRGRRTGDGGRKTEDEGRKTPNSQSPISNPQSPVANGAPRNGHSRPRRILRITFTRSGQL